ncbi:thioredoxin domain-containing protein [Engelhardtia mirabilis]|uniref:Spermatogenesis-associated protein 20-like TRX domain-containing protein n=1 Tax=Engelhardtia mirabilis TaxID=2528011 RepID=A0A518BRP2_9BACT|nr:hypothetical protein Pla133_47470 [Planctomycetes bacterium Pla133]QDV03952.1 hypothetical protein Pla86_47450 [Planctomycetes bacterium Pla86]
MTDSDRPANRLARETSPYLLQHAHNPVDWYPWGAEALERARSENRPIFLSVGYSACHWCHVMEHESFENAELARLMNEHFVNIKVDREERPDVDELYMKAVQAMTGQGGWPMSVFLTPQLEPFFGGTYFPPVGRQGMPGFGQILTAIGERWAKDPELLRGQGRKMAQMLSQEARAATATSLDEGLLDKSLEQLTENFDATWGGFGDAPKFPHAMDIRLLLRHWKRSGSKPALDMARLTLDRMAEGGVYDQLGGGFHRYSTDERWLIPHFEKMLYDNALLIPAYLEAHLICGEGRYARVARECCEWVLREMVTPEGGFASTQDADSEGVEGKFFAWTQEQLNEVLGPQRGGWAAAWFGVTPDGNFEHGSSALWRHGAPDEVARELGVDVDRLTGAMEGARAELFAAREQRVRPATDDKVLAAWNGLMIGALARAHQVLGDGRYLTAARNAARYLLEGMRQDDGRLFATARHGRAHLDAYLDDYAFTISGLLDLYESDFDPRWIRESLALERVLAERFRDDERGGYFTVGADSEQLLVRLKNPHDGALPAGIAVHAGNLTRLAALTGRADLDQEASRVIESVGELANRYPMAFGQLLQVVACREAGLREVVVAGAADDPRAAEMLAALRARFDPDRVVALATAEGDAELLPLLAGRAPKRGEVRGYVCRRGACDLPVDSAAALVAQLS